MIKTPYSRCNTRQHAATRCNTLQHARTHYNTPQHTTPRYRTLPKTPSYQRRHGHNQMIKTPHHKDLIRLLGHQVVLDPSIHGYHSTRQAIQYPFDRRMQVCAGESLHISLGDRLHVGFRHVYGDQHLSKKFSKVSLLLSLPYEFTEKLSVQNYFVLLDSNMFMCISTWQKLSKVSSLLN